MLYTICDPSFISTQFSALNLFGWFDALSKILFFDIPLSYYYINLRLSIIFCLSPGYIYNIYIYI